MATTLYASSWQYESALKVLDQKGIAESHRRFLLAHSAIATRPTTWRELGTSLGYPEATAHTTVNLQYGSFARRLANELGIVEHLPVINGRPFMLHAIAEWAEKGRLGEQAFVMRPEVAAAVRQLGWVMTADRKGGRGTVPIPEPPEPPTRGIDVATPPERIQVTVSRIVRDTQIVRELKALHRHTCQRCGKRLKIGPSAFYSEGHHLRPLGEPHAGPDERQNVLIVCPNCHALLDLVAATLNRKQLRMHPDHNIDPAHLDYHNQLVEDREA
jgi:predicted HNH restriction endonuclease